MVVNFVELICGFYSAGDFFDEGTSLAGSLISEGLDGASDLVEFVTCAFIVYYYSGQR